MPRYALWRQADDYTYTEQAVDDEQALIAFGQSLGMELTLAGEGPCPYMLGRREDADSSKMVPVVDRAVYVVE
nr:hypothetical protein [uncultured Dongia sp.]